MQPPLEAREGLGGEPARLVGLGPRDVGVGAQRGERRGAVAVRADHLDAGERQVALGRDAGARLLGARQPAVAQHHDLAGQVLAGPRDGGQRRAGREGGEAEDGETAEHGVTAIDRRSRNWSAAGRMDQPTRAG